MTAAEIARRLAQNIGALAIELLPNGKKEGHEWRVGSAAGEGGSSLGIHLAGAKAGVWADFATGECGDALDLVRAVHHCDLAQALTWARRWLRIEDGPFAPTPNRAPSSKPKPVAADNDPERWRRPWRQASPITGTLAEVYLKGRGLDFPDPAGSVLRFAPRHLRKDPTGELEHSPALLALLRDVKGGEPCGIVNVYLQADGRDRIRDGKGKTSWGQVRGAAVMLDPFDAPTMGVIIAEGVETAISLHMAELHPVWATAGAGNMSAFPVLAGIEAVTIAADRGEPGQKAAAACAARWRDAGREAFIITPPDAGDWADARRSAA
jgi:putative DNA primase/helicase